MYSRKTLDRALIHLVMQNILKEVEKYVLIIIRHANIIQVRADPKRTNNHFTNQNVKAFIFSTFYYSFHPR